MLALGILAGAAGGEFIHQVRELFQIAPERLGMPPRPPAIEREVMLYALANHAIGFGVMGLVVGGLLGLGLGVLAASTGIAIRMGIVAGVLGIVGGAVGGAAAYITNESLVTVSLDGLFKAMLIHLPNWLLLAAGLAIPAVLFIPRRASRQQIFISAAGAAILTAVLYPILGLIFFRAAASDRPIPDLLGLRLLCFAFGGGVLGLAAARWLRAAPSS
jgi:hypothetical protein